MILTEKEACTKYCCQPLVLEECNNGVTNIGALCVASTCMAWRWSKNHVIEVKKGFCGLAGTPTEGE